MTDLRAMSWPERLQWAVENDLGGAELAHVLGVTQPAVSSAQIHWGIKLRDMRRLNADGRMVKHPLFGENMKQTSSGSRQCKTCMRMHAANARKRRRQCIS